MKYNADDLIEYPGFNVACPEGVIDVSNNGLFFVLLRWLVLNISHLDLLFVQFLAKYVY